MAKYCKTATEAFDYWYKELKYLAGRGFKQPSRAGNVVGEFLNAVTVIEDPTQGIVDSPIRKMPLRYAIGELLWYISASNKLRDIEKFSKFWANISDDGETLNSAYGHRIFKQFGFNQWDYCIEKLMADPYSRQAVIHIKDASDKPTKDTPCTIALQFQVRPDKYGVSRLYLTVMMRSNDIWLGFPFDVFCFTSLQVLMAMQLGVELGTYTHIANSLHLYEKDVLPNGNG